MPVSQDRQQGSPIGASGSPNVPHTHEDGDNSDKKGDQPGYRPYRRWADNLLTVCDADYRAHPEDSRTLQEPYQANEPYECADRCAGDLSCSHARSSNINTDRDNSSALKDQDIIRDQRGESTASSSRPPTASSIASASVVAEVIRISTPAASNA